MLHPDIYFKTYWHYRQQEDMKPERAFIETEKAFYRLYGMRRFVCYQAFRNALYLHKKGRQSKNILLRIVDKFEIKT